MNPGLRLSDAERDEAARILGEHFAEGRLSADEHAERHERIFAATTHGDLPPLFADLPGGAPYAEPEQGPRCAGPTWTPPRRRPPFALIKVALVVLIVLTVLTHLPLILLGLAAWWAFACFGSRRAACGPGRLGRGISATSR